MTRARLALIALLIAIPVMGASQAPGKADRYAVLDTILDIEMDELKMPGVSAAMMENGRLVWTGARGWADKDKGIKVTADTPFNIASLTKPMTAVVLMQLVESGKLSLDTPMQRYEPSFKDPMITVDHVVTMRSEATPPGSSYSYNGNPYGMLNTVIKGVSGEELGQAFSTRLFEPLGLEQTSPGSLKDPKFAEGLSPEQVAHYEGIMARLAVPYNVYGGEELFASFPPDPEPNAAANVVSTASDYALFLDAVMRGRFLKKTTMDEMWTAPVLASGEPSPYAKGWFVREYHGHRIINHYGYYPSAYSAVALIVPEKELVFVALSNGGALSGHNGIAGIEGNAVACAVLIAFVDPALPCKATADAAVAKWRASLPPKRHEMASDPATFSQYAGFYERGDGTEARVFVDRGQLWYQTLAGPLALVQEAPDRFFSKQDDRMLVFARDESGRITRIDMSWPSDSEPTVYKLPRVEAGSAKPNP